jgi:hypothetical protein
MNDIWAAPANSDRWGPILVAAAQIAALRAAGELSGPIERASSPVTPSGRAIPPAVTDLGGRKAAGCHPLSTQRIIGGRRQDWGPIVLLDTCTSSCGRAA